MLIKFLDKLKIELRNIRIHRHEVAGQILGEIAAERLVHGGVLEQRLADSPDHSTDQLAPRCLRIDDSTGAIRPNHSRDARDHEILVEANFDEHRAPGVHGPARVLAEFRRVRSGRPASFRGEGADFFGQTDPLLDAS